MIRSTKTKAHAIGNLAREAGNRLVENGVTIVNVIAATELVIPAIQLPKLKRTFPHR